MTAIACALLSGILYYFAFGLDDAWVLAWIAPTPLLWLAYGDAPRRHVQAAALFASTMGTLYIVQAYGTYVLVAGIAMAVGNGLLLGVASLVARRTRHVLPAAVAVFVFPALWTAMEFAVSLFSPHGAWGAVGYTQVHWPAAVQAASVTGVYGITFIVCLFANAVALALRGERTAGALGTALAVSVVACGYARLAAPQAAPVRVAALSIVPAAGNDYEDLAPRYAAAIRDLAARGVKAIVTPETGMENPMLAPVRAASADTGTLVVAGTHNRTPQRNMAVAYAAGKPALVYDKRHLLLPGEAIFTPGSRPGIIGDGMATAICKDLDFPRTIRSDAGAGIRLMMVPANDFTRDDWMHARQAILRGVENGFAVARVASHGVATVSDDRGRVLAAAPVGAPGLAVATADVALGSGPTFYTRYGDWFAWSCVALAAATAALALGAGRKPRRAAAAAQRPA
jgi:apolipoprotein N-acyltransferase